jgi:hypothetical protein
LRSAYILKDNMYQLSAEAGADSKRDVRFILDNIDYKGVGGGRKKIDIQQSPLTLKWMKILFILSPVIFILSGLFASMAFKITPGNHKIFMKEISRLKSGESKDRVDEKTAKICELLTGKKYADLYL